MAEWKKPVAGGAVTGLFGFGMQFADISERWKHGFAFFGLVGAALAALWLAYLHFTVSSQTYDKVLNAYLSHNTSDRYPLMVLLDAGVLDLKSEEDVSRLMVEIKKERGFDPFHEFEAIPKGRKREALERIRNKQIDVGDSEQMIDFLLSFNDIQRDKHIQ